MALHTILVVTRERIEEEIVLPPLVFVIAKHEGALRFNARE